MTANTGQSPALPADSLIIPKPPQNVEAEQALLGSLLLAPEQFDLIEGRIREDDFFTPAHGRLFAAMQSLRKRNQPVDVILLKDELTRTGDLDAIGGAPGLANLVQIAASGAHVEHYAGIVQDRASLRRLIKVCGESIRAAAEPSAQAQDVIDKAEHGIFEVATRDFGGEAKPVEQVLRDTWDRIDAHLSDNSIVTGLATGYTELDDMLAGLHEDELIIIAGRPAMGKSTFALNLLRRVVTEGNQPAVLYTLEMSAENIVRNMLAAEARIDAQKVRKLQLRAEDRTRLSDATNSLSVTPLWIDETPAISLSEMRGKTRRLKSRFDIKLVIIDYLQLMTASSTARGRSREQEVSEISRGLKALAKELHVPVIALSQLSRKPEGRQDNRPILSDLRESGAIEQDADVVLMLHRPEYYDKNDKPGEAEVIIAKQRNGPTGTVNLTFLSNLLRFENMSIGGDGYVPPSGLE